MNDFVEVGHIIRILRRRWWILVVTMLLAVLAGYAFSTQQPKIYRATASLIVGQNIHAHNPDRFDLELSQQLAGTYADFALRQPVLQAVVDALQLEQSWRTLRTQVWVDPVEATQLLEIRAEATSPQAAAAIADEVARQLILLSQTSFGTQTSVEADEFVGQRLVRLQQNIEAAQRRIDLQESALSSFVGVSLERVSQLHDEIITLQTLIASWESTYASLYDSLRGEPSADQLAVFEVAQTNPEPIWPRVRLNLLIFAVVGFAVGLGIIVLLESTDNTFRSADEVTQVLKLNSLGAIRRIAVERTTDLLIANQDVFSSMAEDCRLLRSKLLFLSKAWPRRTFLVTSPTQGDGKSLVVANLGIATAIIGLKTVIIDANLRSPIQHVLFDLTQAGGLTEEIYSSQSRLARRLKKTGIDNLWVLTSGDLTLASPDRLATARMTELFNALAQQVDIILCDAPEAMSFADTPVLAEQVNGVLVVIDAGHTPRENARQAVYNLRQTGANLLGFVLNRASAQARIASLTHREPPVNEGPDEDQRVPPEYELKPPVHREPAGAE